ncbi:MAG: hypothetical protein GEU95_04680 [Rhizobiales bacterium]|nr:hypothetical protein [Hyphomicrobiales bacterium]
MQQVEGTPVWKKCGLALTLLLAGAAIGIWAKSNMLASKPAIAGATAVAPVEASAISPSELMITGGRGLPATEYAEPF